MYQWLEFFGKIMDTSDWPARWHCGRWTDFHGWLYIVSDVLIWSSYFIIPLLILRFIIKKNDLRFFKLYILFASFIFACGTTHLLDALIFWWPAYRLSALVRLFTGIVSWATVLVVVQNVPKAFALKSPEELEAEVETRKIAEAKLAEKNKQLNEAQIIAKMGSWEWNPSNDKLVWSENMYRIFGMIPTDQLALSDFFKRVHPEDVASTRACINAAVSSGAFPEFTYRIILSQGEERTLLARGEVMMNESGIPFRVVGTAQDITEQIKTQQDLITKTSKLESANSELQRYAYVASHDLQEPLRKISTFVSMLKGYDGLVGDEQAQRYMTKIEAAAVRMQSLINDVLQFSSLSMDNSRRIRVDLNSVVNQVISDLELTIENEKVQIEVGLLGAVEGNEIQLGQLFQNLISNAIKFRSPDRAPRIRINAQQSRRNSTRSDEMVFSVPNEIQKITIISIQDNGIGFEADYKEVIFEMFKRLHSRSEFEGTGIGLAICKRIVEFHNGQITVSSTPGQGSTFTVVLPSVD